MKLACPAVGDWSAADIEIIQSRQELQVHKAGIAYGSAIEIQIPKARQFLQ